jgi:hypothetical protein
MFQVKISYYAGIITDWSMIERLAKRHGRKYDVG